MKSKRLWEPGEITIENHKLDEKLYVNKTVNVVVKKDGSEKVTTNYLFMKTLKIMKLEYLKFC